MAGRVGGAAAPALLVADELPPLTVDPRDDFVIAVVDTGVTVLEGLPHAYIGGHLAPGWEQNLDSPENSLALLNGASQTAGEDGHGTFVAGLILRQAPAARILMRNPLDAAGGSGLDAAVAAVLDELAGVEQLKLVNLSFFGGHEAEAPEGIRAALGRLLHSRPDIVVVTAAGNDGSAEPAWPAAFNAEFEQVISIGAADDTAVWLLAADVPSVAEFSNHGPSVDAYAAGVDVLGPRLWPGGDGYDSRMRRPSGWARWSGSSFAAASVTGRIAEVMLSQGVPASAARDQVLQGPPVSGPDGSEGRPWVATDR